MTIDYTQHAITRTRQAATTAQYVVNGNRKSSTVTLYCDTLEQVFSDIDLLFRTGCLSASYAPNDQRPVAPPSDSVLEIEP